MNKKRKICFVITSKIHYARSKLILEKLRDRDDVELQLVVGASAILDQFGDTLALLERDGFEVNEKIVMTLSGGSTIAMAKTAGLGIIEFTTAFDNLKPEVVVLRGDRYEILSAAIAAAYLNITVAHIEGGDVTGTIDESVRHAVTKLAHIHFATNERSLQRLHRMGERPEHVYNFGDPGLEYMEQHTHELTPDIIDSLGVGGQIDFEKPFIMVLYHPVTSDIGNNRKNTEEVLKAIHKKGMQTIWLWPNADAGTNQVSKAIRAYREHNDMEFVRFIKYVSPEIFATLLKKSTMLVGNSSAGIKESSFLGIPTINIGNRQEGRMRAENVISVEHDEKEILKALETQFERGRYPQSNIYYKKNVAQNIVDTLVVSELYSQKKFVD